MTRPKTLLQWPVLPYMLRGKDSDGSGAFGASRNGHIHQGIDIVVSPGQNVYSPITGYISRFPQPYSDKPQFKGIEIIGEGSDAGMKVKIFYCSPQVGKLTKVSRGQMIATAQDIAGYYNANGGSMTNHIHLELRKGSELLDPTPYFI